MRQRDSRPSFGFGGRITGITLCFFIVGTMGVHGHRQNGTSALLNFNPQADKLQHEEFLSRFLKAFGMENESPRGKRRGPVTPPPQYMLDLYKAVAGSNGITQAHSPYHANVVRSYADRDYSHNFRFFFNVSSNASKKDRILEAEFHLYKLKPRNRAKGKIKQLKSQLLEVQVYQVLKHGKKKRKNRNHKLLGSRRMSVESTGWEIFYIRQAVDDWIKDNSTNLGLMISVKTIENETVPPGIIRFAKSRRHYISKQPLLVLFVDDEYHNYIYPGFTNRTTHGRPHTHRNKQRKASTLAKPRHQLPSRSQRAVGHAAKDSSSQRQSCMRHDLYVDFEKIGWSAWIISPKGYNAYYCKGDCTFPLGQNQWPTNHATVQSIVQYLQLTPGVGTPCCVPNKLYSISLLYFDEHENVILKQYDDMVASSCGCH